MKTVVLSVVEKAWHDCVRCGPGKMSDERKVLCR